MSALSLSVSKPSFVCVTSGEKRGGSRSKTEAEGWMAGRVMKRRNGGGRNKE